jgi:hypothetical protein
MRFSVSGILPFLNSSLLRLIVASFVLVRASAPVRAADSSIEIAGPGSRPYIGFACCDKGIAAMQSLFADPAVLANLVQLHAGVAVEIADFSPERAAIVRQLAQAGIPVTAWIVLAPEQGFYINASNAPAAAERVAQFEQWTTDNHLRWAAVGLDIEPDFGQLAALKSHRWRLFTTLLSQALDSARIVRAQQAYTSIVQGLQSHGFVVQTYLMPYVPAERDVHVNLIDRMLGTVDVRGDREYLMVYTSYAHQAGAAMVWSLGRNELGITVGVTDGDGTPGTANGPLDWNEFSRDLLVAGHYTRNIGVYNLEGCVRQGFLPRLLTMNWSQSVVIPAASISHAERLGFVLRTVLWTAAHLIWFITAAILLLAWLIAWRRNRRRRNPAV